MKTIIGDPEEVVTAVEHQARRAARDRESEGEERVRELRRRRTERAREARRAVIDAARSALVSHRRSRLPDAAARARRMRLEARDEVLEQVWSRAESKLRDLTGEDEYEAVLRQLAMRAARAIDTSPILLAADPDGHELLDEERLEEWSESATEEAGRDVVFQRRSEPAETWGGLIAQDEEGRRRADLTFSTRLRTAREEFRDRVADVLVRDA
ncbi:MAG: V-type ATP synthase subunit E family protein [Candidatus Longimicrobiales bacterium M2_2A_002]